MVVFGNFIHQWTKKAMKVREMVSQNFVLKRKKKVKKMDVGREKSPNVGR